ncbi:MAG: zinc-dependent metalloprotease, partial [Saprospiraceae bacterium]|nr:zinc-dependent metalloprotease [Saprospiraceae bacterium]
PKLVEWSNKDGQSYAELEEVYDALIGQYRRYMGHVAKNVGGVYDDPMTSDMVGQPFRPVPKATQKEAVSFLNKYAFTAPLWLMDMNIISKIRPESGIEVINSIQESALNTVLSPDKLIRLMEFGNKDGYSVDELLTDLESTIILKGGETNIYDRNLQKIYISKMISLLTPGSQSSIGISVGTPSGRKPLTVNLNDSDVPSIVRGHLTKLRKIASARAIEPRSAVEKYHYDDLQMRIYKALKGDKGD